MLDSECRRRGSPATPKPAWAHHGFGAGRGGHSSPPVICVGGHRRTGASLASQRCCCSDRGRAILRQRWALLLPRSPRTLGTLRGPFPGDGDAWQAQALPLPHRPTRPGATCAGTVTVPSVAQLCAAAGAMLSGARAGQLGAASSARDRTETWGPRGHRWPPPRAVRDSPAAGQQLHGITPCCRDGDHTWKSTCSPLPAPPRAWLCQLLPGRMSLALLHFPLPNEARNGTGTERARSEPLYNASALPCSGDFSAHLLLIHV